MIYRQPSVAGDAAIGVFDSPNTQVLHNSILASGTYSSLIEYRVPNSTGMRITNHLLDGRIMGRDGATATVGGNVTSATPALFVNPQREICTSSLARRRDRSRRGARERGRSTAMANPARAAPRLTSAPMSTRPRPHCRRRRTFDRSLTRPPPAHRPPLPVC